MKRKFKYNVIHEYACENSKQNVSQSSNMYFLILTKLDSNGFQLDQLPEKGKTDGKHSNGCQSWMVGRNGHKSVLE